MTNPAPGSDEAPMTEMNEREQESLSAYRYQVLKWNKLVSKYLEPTQCDRDDVQAIANMLDNQAAEIKRLEAMVKSQSPITEGGINLISDVALERVKGE